MHYVTCLGILNTPTHTCCPPPSHLVLMPQDAAAPANDTLLLTASAGPRGNPAVAYDAAFWDLVDPADAELKVLAQRNEVGGWVLVGGRLAGCVWPGFERSNSPAGGCKLQRHVLLGNAAQRPVPCPLYDKPFLPSPPNTTATTTITPLLPLTELCPRGTGVAAAEPPTLLCIQPPD